MSNEHHNPESLLFSALAQGGLLLTVNDRLARHLRMRYDAHRLAAGDRVWPTPDILPLGAWLRRCHQDLVDQGITTQPLLSPAQERQLWERVIASGEPDVTLLRPAAAARSAMEAYRVLHGWQLADHPELTHSPEGEAFVAWAEQFDRHCHAHAGLPGCRLPALLTDALTQAQLQPPAVIWLAGFDDHSPDQQALFDALQAVGCRLQILAPAPAQKAPLRLACPDPASEQQWAAHWALTRLQTNPQARIAIVSPDLQGQREALRQVLTDTLAPDSLVPDNTDDQLPFNFSLGLPLADQPLIRDALLLLNLCLAKRESEGLEQAEIAQLLRSPFIGDGLSESTPRALLDAELKHRGFPRYTLGRLQQQLGTLAPEGPLHCPALTERINTLSHLLSQQTHKADTRHWADHFQQWLGAWGWPGERSLTSQEYQQTQAFNSLLAELASLARVSTACGAKLALNKLQQLAQETLFQAEGSNAPIQVLGVLEAAGQHFDHLWLIGLDSAHWPPAPAPNPLLPSSLQRQHGLPHASAERELRFARQVMARLSGAADELIYSHAIRNADGEQDASPLISTLPVGSSDQLGLPTTTSSNKAIACEPFVDWQAPPAPNNLPGGTHLLGDQAACPFRAFARYRLSARSLETVSHGPDPRTLGTQVHSLLEALWRELGSQQHLQQLSNDDRDALIARTVSATLAATGRARPDLYTPAFLTLEQQRLTRLMQDWLDTELARAPFTIQHLEQRSAAQIGPLQLTIQADRIDTLTDGRTVVIDYKTGRGQRTGTWTDDRPEDSQMPLYAIHQPTPVAAAVIARVRADKDSGFKGLAEDEGLLPGIKAFKGTDGITDWAALQQHWQQRLTALAEEIIAGRADPTPSAQACRYCDLPALCRIALMDADDDTQGGNSND